MRTINDVKVIDLLWDGPYSVDHVTSHLRNGGDYGIYQIYGTHALLGADTLLYIGRAEINPFGQRIPAHKEWIDWESSVTNVFVGRLSGQDEMTKERDSEWKEMIRRAEALLIYFCTPPYNSSGIKSLPACPPTILLNYRRHHRLPLVISNIYDATPVWEESFKPYCSAQ